MIESDRNDSHEAQPPQRRKRAWWSRILLALLLFALVQSITLTESVNSVALDAVTREPLAGVPIALIWRLENMTPGGANPGSVLKTAQVTTDADGRFHVPPALLLHAPLVPYSLSVRSTRYMPLLLACKFGYLGQEEWANDIEDPFTGFFMLRGSTLDERPFEMRPLPARGQPLEDRTYVEGSVAMNEGEMQGADSLCSGRVLCQHAALTQAIASCKDALRSIQDRYGERNHVQE